MSGDARDSGRRRPGPPKRYSSQVNVLVSPSQRQRLEHLAAQQHTSVSAVIRQAVEFHLEAHAVNPS